MLGRSKEQKFHSDLTVVHPAQGMWVASRPPPGHPLRRGLAARPQVRKLAAVLPWVEPSLDFFSADVTNWMLANWLWQIAILSGRS
jgi:hypothetical protein